MIDTRIGPLRLLAEHEYADVTLPPKSNGVNIFLANKRNDRFVLEIDDGGTSISLFAVTLFIRTINGKPEITTIPSTELLHAHGMPGIPISDNVEENVAEAIHRLWRLKHDEDVAVAYGTAGQFQSLMQDLVDLSGVAMVINCATGQDAPRSMPEKLISPAILSKHEKYADSLVHYLIRVFMPQASCPCAGRNLYDRKPRQLTFRPQPRTGHDMTAAFRRTDACLKEIDAALNTGKTDESLASLLERIIRERAQ